MSTSNGPRTSPSTPTTPSPSASSTDSPGNSLQHTPATWRKTLGRRLAVGDAVVIAIASVLAYLTREAVGRAELAVPFADEVPVALAITPLWVLAFYLAGAYRPEYLNAGGDATRRFLAGLTAGVLALGFTSFVLNLQLSRLFVAFVAVYVFLGGILLRAGMRRYIRARRANSELVQRALIVGTDTDARQLADALAHVPDSSYAVIGYLDEQLPQGTAVHDAHVLGTPGQVTEIAASTSAGVVIASPAGISPGTLRDLTIALEGTPVDLAVAPSLFQVVTRRMTIETIGNTPILHVDQIRLERSKAVLKRAVDLVVAVTLLVVTAPLVAIAAMAVKRSSPGPVLFRQTRVGRDGQPFEILKLRTMHSDADDRRDEFAHLNEADGPLFKITDDPRVTSTGRWLRRWSIDELPQLVNVVRGEMSMVGPRPPLPEEVAAYDAWQHRRLRVRPGITGVWQTSGRSEVPFDEAVRMDLFYIENWSLTTDLALMLRTIRAVVSRRGAW